MPPAGASFRHRPANVGNRQIVGDSVNIRSRILTANHPGPSLIGLGEGVLGYLLGHKTIAEIHHHCSQDLPTMV